MHTLQGLNACAGLSEPFVHTKLIQAKPALMAFHERLTTDVFSSGRSEKWRNLTGPTIPRACSSCRCILRISMISDPVSCVLPWAVLLNDTSDILGNKMLRLGSVFLGV